MPKHKPSAPSPEGGNLPISPHDVEVVLNALPATAPDKVVHTDLIELVFKGRQRDFPDSPDTFTDAEIADFQRETMPSPAEVVALMSLAKKVRSLAKAIHGPPRPGQQRRAMLGELGDSAAAMRSLLSLPRSWGNCRLGPHVYLATAEFVAAANDPLCDKALTGLVGAIREMRRAGIPFLDLRRFYQEGWKTHDSGTANKSDNKGLPVDPITLEQAATLVQQSKQTLKNRSTEGRPDPVRRCLGNRPAIWSYAELRPWLLEKFLDASHRLSADYETAKELFGG